MRFSKHTGLGLVSTVALAIAGGLTLSSNAGANTTQWNFAAKLGTLGTSQSYSGVASNGSGPAITAYGYQITDATSQAHDRSHEHGQSEDHGHRHKKGQSDDTANQITCATSSSHDLYGKLGGGDENGLGLNRFVDGEIDSFSQHGRSQVGFIQLDLSNVITSYNGTGTLTVDLGSVTGSDAYVLSATNRLGQIGSEIVSGGATPSGIARQVVSLCHFNLADRYMTISATTGSSVLLRSLQYSGTSPNADAPEPTALAVFVLGGMALLLMPRTKPTGA